MAIDLSAVRDEDLGQLSDAALAELEDQLLLATELDLSSRAQFTSGRLVVYALSAIGMVLLLSLHSLLPTERLGPLNIPLYLLALGAGAGGAHLLWARVGMGIRAPVRWALAHWPVLLYLLALLYQARSP